METGSMTSSAGRTELLSHTLSLRHPSLVLCHCFCASFFSLSHLCLLHNCLWADGLDSSVTENMEALCCSHPQLFTRLYVFPLCLHFLSPRLRGEVPRSHQGSFLYWSFCDAFPSLWNVILTFPLVCSFTSPFCHSLLFLHA